MRKVAKFFKWVLIVLIGIHVAAFIGFWIYAMKAKGSTSEAHIAYLAENKELIKPNAVDLDLLDDEFYEHQLFFLGESHGFEVPQQLDIMLLTQLNKKVGLRHYLAEVDHSQAYFLNMYLQTGDEALLRQVFQFWTDINAQWANQEFYNKIKSIRQYNETLPAAQRIKIVGVDKIQDPELLKAHMQSIITDTASSAGKAAADSSAIKEELLAYFTGDWEQMMHKASELQEKVQENSATYQSLLGADYFTLNHTLTNLQYKEGSVRRDSVMFLNLQALTSAQGLENEKLYGLWGMHHTYQASVNGTMPFAALIKQSALPYKDKLVTLAVMTLDSEMMVPTNVIPASFRPAERYVSTGLANFDGPMVFMYGVDDLREVTEPNTTTLFKLDKQGSPYFGSDRLISSASPVGGSLKPTESSIQVTDYFQYLILVRNSKALNPLELGSPAQ